MSAPKGQTEIKETREFLCVVCRIGVISEERVASFPPDHLAGYDSVRYGGFLVNNGRLFKTRPDTVWTSTDTTRLREILSEERPGDLIATAEAKIQVGGICANCLENPVVIALLPYLPLSR